MSVVNIRQAVREGARLVIGLAGVSGSGKTRSALELAWGLAKGDASKIGFLDTENRRGSLYADCLVGKDGSIHRFNIGDLYAPYSPKRYSDAIKEFQQTGIEVLVVDSASHEWEGEGGCEDIADDGGKVANWKKAKREHKRFMNTLLTCDMHIIVCLRAREKTSFKNPSKPESLGIQPICEKNFLFEMTASVMMHDEGRRREVIKCPAELRPFIGHDREYLSAQDGMAIRKWVDGGAKLDPEIERARNSILTITHDGAAAVNAAWQALPAKVQKGLGESFIAMARQSAQAFDDQREDAEGMVPLGMDGGFNPGAVAGGATVAALDPEPPKFDDGDPFDRPQ